MRKWLPYAFILLLLLTPLGAQVSNPSIVSVASAPSGACTSGLPNQQVVSTGTQYSCQNGTWAALGGGGGGGTSVSQNSGAAETSLPVTGYMPQVCSDVSGSGTAQSCTVANSFTPQAGNCIVYKTTTANSGTGLTVNVDSLGAKSVAVPGSSGWTTTLVASSSIPANKPMNLCYDGTNWNASGTGFAAGGGTPTTIPNLIWWFSADRNSYNNGTFVSSLYDTSTASTASPARTGVSGPTYATGAINSQPAITFLNNSNSDLSIYPPAQLKQSTTFVVAAPGSGGSTIFGGSSGALQFNVGSGASYPSLTKSFVAVIGTGTATLTAGTWYQVNATYNDGTGAYAFRVARATAGSGTSVNTITWFSDSLGWIRQGGAGSDSYSGKIAEVIVYNRVLTGAEITTIETYLNGKYGI